MSIKMEDVISAEAEAFQREIEEFLAEIAKAKTFVTKDIFDKMDRLRPQFEALSETDKTYMFFGVLMAYSVVAKLLRETGAGEVLGEIINALDQGANVENIVIHKQSKDDDDEGMLN